MEYKKMAKKIILCIILVIMVFSLTGCQTLQGVGGDIQWTARKCAGVLEGAEKPEAETEEEEH
jgi:predicted small secreted protein